MSLRAYPPPSGNNIKRGKTDPSADLQKAEVLRFRAAVAAMPENSRYRTAAKMRWLRDVMRAGELKPAARVVAGVLLDYLGARGMAWPGLNRLEADTKFSRSTVQRSLADLVEAGWLLENRATGRGNASAYTIDWKRFSEERASQVTPFSEEGDETEERVSSMSEKGVKSDAERVSPVTPQSCYRIQERNPGAGASAREEDSGKGAGMEDSANPEQLERAERQAGFQGVKADPEQPRTKGIAKPEGRLSDDDRRWQLKLESFSKSGVWLGPGPAPGVIGCQAPLWLVEDVLATSESSEAHTSTQGPDPMAAPAERPRQAHMLLPMAGGRGAVGRNGDPVEWRARLGVLKRRGRWPLNDHSCRRMRIELGDQSASEVVRKVFGAGWTLEQVEDLERGAA